MPWEHRRDSERKSWLSCVTKACLLHLYSGQWFPIFLFPHPTPKCLWGRTIIANIFMAGMVTESSASIQSPPHLIMFHLVNKIGALSPLLPRLQMDYSLRRKRKGTALYGRNILTCLHISGWAGNTALCGIMLNSEKGQMKNSRLRGDAHASRAFGLRLKSQDGTAVASCSAIRYLGKINTWYWNTFY